jgi:hypothetical protein
MSNKVLQRAPDKSVAKALRAAQKEQGKLSFASAVKIIQAAHDGGKVDDVEFRDLKKILRTQPLWGPARRLIEGYLALYYPLKGPYVYPGDVETLDNSDLVGSHQCAALVQLTVPIGLTATWREGIPVRGNDHLIQKGTAVATFEDGFYPNRNHGNHVAYYVSQNATGVVVIDQWSGKGSVSSRTMDFLGRTAAGRFVDPSNNGDALSVIMTKA